MQSRADSFLWDSEVKGFGLRVKPSGTKSYVLKYRIGPRTRRLTIGRHGSPWTPEEARRRALDLLRDVKNGRDPATEKTEARRDLTVADLADFYLDQGAAEKPNKKPSSWVTDRSNIERHIKPLLGRKIAKALTRADVARFQADVAVGKSKADIRTKSRGRAIVKGGRGTAARSLAVLGAILQFGIGQGLIPTNRARGVRLLKGERKERFLSEAEVARLADALVTMETEAAISPIAAAAVRLLLLTGCRKSEILTLRWDWVDPERKCLRLPDGGKRAPRSCRWLRRCSNCWRNFPGGTTRYSCFPPARAMATTPVSRKIGSASAPEPGCLGCDCTTLRHSFASFAVADGHSLLMVGKVLGHNKQARRTAGVPTRHLSADPVIAVADRTGCANLDRDEGASDLGTQITDRQQRETRNLTGLVLTMGADS